jgi:hypothetical protein
MITQLLLKPNALFQILLIFILMIRKSYLNLRFLIWGKRFYFLKLLKNKIINCLIGASNGDHLMVILVSMEL